MAAKNGSLSINSENLLMLTLSRGGPIVWISETDARELTIVDSVYDNDGTTGLGNLSKMIDTNVLNKVNISQDGKNWGDSLCLHRY